MTPEFSFIIPVWNEESVILRTIEHILSLQSAAGAEIIVVDGDPAGKTMEIARRASVKTVISERGRGSQMNHGAALAAGNILIFLHADTRLPPYALGLIDTVMRDESCTAGAFDLAIDSERPVFRLIEKAASLRSRLTRVPYGDQAVFMRKDVFNELGGFRNIPIMEDVEIMRRIKRRGGKICIIDKAVRTSSRRWDREGIVYTTLRNWLLITLYLLGVKPEKLVKFYR
ncbi:MAG TPA: TIGR04283 family arsenosugar biosynthesis glycosyltransferase [Syntrophales bacterium]|nr:TIGR04283 family arsenosugar biosynthesis glycosyltransferase [Syntrophales bacterium]